MDIATILIGLAMAAAVIAYVAEPLMRKPGWTSPGAATSARTAELETEYRATLEAIRDLDFDFQTGKVVADDYRAWREKYAARGAALLKELDAARAGQTVASDDAIEAMIRARRKTLGQICPMCSHPCLPGDRYCRKCGAALSRK